MSCFYASSVFEDAHQPPNVIPDQSNPTKPYSCSSKTYNHHLWYHDSILNLQNRLRQKQSQFAKMEST
jgi:hypothetical protein